MAFPVFKFQLAPRPHVGQTPRAKNVNIDLTIIVGSVQRFSGAQNVLSFVLQPERTSVESSHEFSTTERRSHLAPPALTAHGLYVYRQTLMTVLTAIYTVHCRRSRTAMIIDRHRVIVWDSSRARARSSPVSLAREPEPVRTQYIQDTYTGAHMCVARSRTRPWDTPTSRSRLAKQADVQCNLCNQQLCMVLFRVAQPQYVTVRSRQPYHHCARFVIHHASRRAKASCCRVSGSVCCGPLGAIDRRINSAFTVAKPR